MVGGAMEVGAALATRTNALCRAHGHGALSELADCNVHSSIQPPAQKERQMSLMGWFICPVCGRNVEATVKDFQSSGWSRLCDECKLKEESNVSV